MSKKVLTGIVTSAKMQKTVVVEIERLVRHPIYKKILKKTGKIKADTGEFSVQAGQVVKIEQIRPMSRDKHFKVIAIVEKGEAK